MKIAYTEHAEYSISKRKIERVWIEEAIKSPDLLYKDEGKYYAQKKLNNHQIEVVYVKEKYIKVITVYWL